MREPLWQRLAVFGLVVASLAGVSGCGYAFSPAHSVTSNPDESPSAVVCLRLSDMADNDVYDARFYGTIKRALTEALVSAGHQSCDNAPRRDIKVQSWSLVTDIASYTSTARRRSYRVTLTISVVSERVSELPAYEFMQDTYIDDAVQDTLREQMTLAAAKDLSYRLVPHMLRSPLAQREPIVEEQAQ